MLTNSCPHFSHMHSLPPHTHTHTHTHVPADLTAQHSNHLLSCNFNPKEGLVEKSPHDTIISLDDDSLEPSSSSSSPYNEEYTRRKLSLTVTTFAWLPALLKAEIKGKLTRLALVALATRIGHVVLMGVEVPLFAEQ